MGSAVKVRHCPATVNAETQATDATGAHASGRLLKVNDA